MMIFPLANVPLVMKVIAVLWVLMSISLILIVLLQKGRGGGLSSAFGGAGASSLLGTKTGDFLTWVTIGLVVCFLVFAVVMAKYWKPSTSMELDSSAPASQQVPAETEAPADAPMDTENTNPTE